MATQKTGGEVDAFCTKCQLTLAHTILAMVGEKIARVRCNTCGGDHAMRGAPGASKSSSSRAAAKPRASRSEAPAKTVISFEQRLEEKDVGAARTYSPKETFGVDEVIRHPTFGLGLVTAVRLDKIDVDFKAAQKTLIHGRGGAPAAPPAFSPPPSKPTGPSDKPMAAESSQVPASSTSEE